PVLPPGAPRPHHRPAAGTDLGHLPLRFEENRGQADKQVLFLFRGRGYTLFIHATEEVLPFASGSGQNDDGHGRVARKRAALRLQFRGASPSATPVGRDELPGGSHYLTENDPSRWSTDVKASASVVYRDLYSGIDLIYRSNAGRLGYDLLVWSNSRSGADR